MQALINNLITLAVGHLQKGDVDSAQRLLKQSLTVAPKHSEAWRLLGVSFAFKRDLQEALKALDKAIKVEPNNWLAYSNQGNILKDLGRHKEALRSYDRALAIQPSYAEAHNNKGNLFQEINQIELALECYDRAIALQPNYAEAYNNKGNALQRLNRYEEGLSAFDTAISINPSYAEAYRNKSKTLQVLRAPQEALALLEIATKIAPTYSDAQFDMALLHLRMLNFQAGWDKYEWRWKKENLNPPELSSTKPVWNGEKIQGRLLVWAEQGVGDKILFSSVFQELALSASKIMISTDSRLVSIYQRSFPEFEILDSAIPISDNDYDVQTSIGSLMKFFRLSTKDFKNPSFPYLIDNKDRTSALRAKLRLDGKLKKICGISWRSAGKETGDHKSVPTSQMLPIFDLKQYQFVNLQYGDISSDLEYVEAECGQVIQQFVDIDLYNDIDGVLSIIQACDLVVTSSNSIAHMAGALNKCTILILPQEVGRLWYWYEVDGYSLCYPSIRIFSQSLDGSWEEVIQRVKAYMGTLSFE